jgi:PKD repeat protein
MWVSCEKEQIEHLPVACFEVADTAELNQLLTFTNCSDEKAVNYLWDFGDGATSREKSPRHRFSELGTFTVSLTVVDEDSLSNNISKDIFVKNPEVSTYFLASFTKDYTLHEGMHIFLTSAEVSGATLTIMPGAIIKFNKDAGISVSSDGNNKGAIIAHGTQGNPIIFTANSDEPVPGFWKDIYFHDGCALSSFKHCVFEYGGTGNSFSASGYASIVVGDSPFEIQHSIIRYSGSGGIKLNENTNDVLIDHNIFNSCQVSALTTTPNMAGEIGLNNTFDENASILISPFDNLDAKLVTWNNLSIPYRLDQSLTIASEAGSTLILKPGVEVQIKKAFMVNIGNSSGTGRLIAKGTAEQPIVFTSAATDKAINPWNGININNSTDSVSYFKNCIFDYGGFDGIQDSYAPKGVIHVRDKSVSVENCTFENFRSPAIYLDPDRFFETMTNNTFIGHDQVGVYIHPNGVHTIGLDNIYNVASGVVIYKGTMSHKSATWKKLSTPYYLIDDIGIAALTEADTEGATLTLAPGVTLKLGSGVSIIIGGSYLGKGSLIADGSVETITFTKSGAYNWKSILFQKAMPGTILNNCIIEYGGKSVMNGSVHIAYNDDVTITNNIIRNSDHYGLSHQGCNPVISDNQLIDNAKDGILITY